MWAMMPIFRYLLSGVVRAISFLYSAKTRGDQAPIVGRFRSADTGRLSASSVQDPLSRVPKLSVSGFPGLPPGVSPPLPAVVGKCPVGFRHPVRVFLLFYRLAFALRRQNQLGGEALGHRLFFARAAVQNQPPHRQRRAPLRP